MADLNAVYKALEKAHAAGDTKSAKTLADYIRSQAGVSEEAAPESSVQDVTQQQKDLTQAPSSAIRRYIADPALGLAKGVVGAGEAVIGLADIPTMGLAGKAADAIEKVEVITNPSARYDAEGGAGIINIVLKKGKNNGINGTFIATVGNPRNYNATGTINFKRTKYIIVRV